MMRDLGYNFKWRDKYASPLLVNGFEWDEVEKIDLITAFEVFEHFTDPVSELEGMLKISKSIIFTTTCYDTMFNWKKPDWWYYAQEGGQHVAFYSEYTLKLLAQKYNLNYYKFMGLYLFTEKKFNRFKIFLLEFAYKIGICKWKWINAMNSEFATRDMKKLEEDIRNKAREK